MTSLVAIGIVSSDQIRDVFGELSQLEKYKRRKFNNTSNSFFQNENLLPAVYLCFFLHISDILFATFSSTTNIFPHK